MHVGSWEWEVKGNWQTQRSRQRAKCKAQQTLTVSLKQNDSIVTSPTSWQELIHDSFPCEELNRCTCGPQVSSGGGSSGWDLEMALLKTFRCVVSHSEGLGNKLSSWQKLTHPSICWISYARVDIPRSSCVLISWDCLILICDTILFLELYWLLMM